MIHIGTIRALPGVFDVPLHRADAKRQGASCQENSGAVRFMEHGNLPFNDDCCFHMNKWSIKDFEKELIASNGH